MKTFATLALLGFASAIKLQTNDELAKELADLIMVTCGTNSDGQCEISELDKVLLEMDISENANQSIYAIGYYADYYYDMNDTVTSEELIRFIEQQFEYGGLPHADQLI